MLTIFVLDHSAEARNGVVSQVNKLLEVEPNDQLLLPRINIRPISKQEIKFHAAPDILIMGHGLAALEMSEIAAVKKLIPSTPILVKLSDSINNLTTIEQMARLGADDIFSDNTSPEEFVRKIILLARKRSGAKNGRLIVVDSGKGGIGITSVVAALGEIISGAGKKVALIDLDFDSQDLSRFLQVRPFINENLQLIVEQQRPVSEDSVRQCILPVWEDDENLFCIPPIPDADAAHDPRSLYPRMLLSVLEVLDAMFDFVIVDIGSARGAIQRAIHRVADKIVFLTANDPACVYASVEKLNRLKGTLSAGAELILFENARQRHSLPASILRSEICRMAKLSPSVWLDEAVPFCSTSSRWPGSGSTLGSNGNKSIVHALRALAARLGVIEGRALSNIPAAGVWDSLRSLITRKRATLPADEQRGNLSYEQPPRGLPAPGELVQRPRLTEECEYSHNSDTLSDNLLVTQALCEDEAPQDAEPHRAAL